jgi:hypothetical protein
VSPTAEEIPGLPANCAFRWLARAYPFAVLPVALVRKVQKRVEFLTSVLVDGEALVESRPLTRIASS